MRPNPIPGNFQHSSFGHNNGFQQPPQGFAPQGGYRPMPYQGGAPQGWRPPPGAPGYGPRPRKSGSGLLMGCGIAAAILVAVPVLLVTIGVFAVDDVPSVSTTAAATTRAPEPDPTTPEPEPDPQTPEPEPEPSPPEPDPEPNPPQGAFQLPPRDFGELPPPHSSEPAWVTVQQADFYTARFPDLEGCPEPAYIEDTTALEAYTTAQLACIQAAWDPVLTELGYSNHDIPHYYYSGSEVSSPCGTSTAPAFYCSVDGGAIYFGEDLLKGTAYDPIWGKDLTGHEYGHHLQTLSGFWNAFNQLPGGNEVWRRLEIQATCYSMGMLRRDSSHVLTQETFGRLEPHLRSFLDDGIHGSPDSLAYWGMRGFYADVTGECNTWVVGSEWVE